MQNFSPKQYLFKKNYHKAKKFTLGKVDGMIANYPKQYSTPKYLLFIQEFLKDEWEVKVYEAGVSKYVFLTKGDHRYKIRFSNHKPIYQREIENDCDYYVGISHTKVHTTQEIINLIKTK